MISASAVRSDDLPDGTGRACASESSKGGDLATRSSGTGTPSLTLGPGLEPYFNMEALQRRQIIVFQCAGGMSQSLLQHGGLAAPEDCTAIRLNIESQSLLQQGGLAALQAAKSAAESKARSQSLLQQGGLAAMPTFLSAPKTEGLNPFFNREALRPAKMFSEIMPLVQVSIPSSTGRPCGPSCGARQSPSCSVSIPSSTGRPCGHPARSHRRQRPLRVSIPSSTGRPCGPSNHRTRKRAR